ncbi:MAG: pilus assembly protein PilP [Syntrophales bacterium]
MTKRSKLTILSVWILTICILSVWALFLDAGPVFARARGGKAASSSVKTKGETTKAAVAGAAGGAVVGAAAARAVRGRVPGDAQADPSADVKDSLPSGATVAAVKPAGADSLIFSYDPKGKPDPFKPFVEAELALRKLKEAQFKKQQQKLPLSPLQRLGIEQFKIVGIGGNEKGRTAVVQDMAGKYYTLSIGTPIGMNKGKVAKILGDRVIVEEPTTGGKRGKTGAKKVEMKLLKESEEVKP